MTRTSDQTPERRDDRAKAGVDRRDFLKAAGFAVGASLTAGCRRPPAEEAVPFLEQSEDVVPGKAVWYASACSACPAGCGTLVKTRDGRPVKLEGNPDHPLSRGGLCALGQASVLGLYDTLRLQEPLVGGTPGEWPAIDGAIRDDLAEIADRGGTIRLLTGTLSGPAERAAVERFVDGWRTAGADAVRVAYDGLSSSAIREAHERTHGRSLLPRYRFDRADVVVSFDADFLGTWISPVEHTAAYRSRRAPDGHGLPHPARHIQVEARMSLTGTNADERLTVEPGALGLAVTHLAARIARLAGDEPAWGTLGDPPVDAARLDALARELWAARGGSLVVSGSQDADVQALVNLINHHLGAYGTTLDAAAPSAQREGDDRRLAGLLDELRSGAVDAVLVSGVDPVAELPNGEAIAEALGRAPLTVATATHRTATADACRYVCPEPHFLESWRDAEPVAGVAALAQPTLRPLGATRPLIESLAAWSPDGRGLEETGSEGGAPPTAYRQIRAHWRRHVFPRRRERKPYPSGDFQGFWDWAVHDGVALLRTEPAPTGPFRADGIRPIPTAQRLEPGHFALVLHPEVGILDGRGAENPWIQELPDPVTKVTWENVAALSPNAAREHGLEEGDMVRIDLDRPRGPRGLEERTADRQEPLELPLLIQPGQHDRVVAVALGYGRQGTARFAGVGPRWIEKRPTVEEDTPVGVSISPWLALEDGALRYERSNATVHGTGRRRELARTQRWHRMEMPEDLARRAGRGGEPRNVARETTLAALVHDADQGSHGEGHGGAHPTLWAEHRYDGHRWGLMIDLAACTGCSACVVSCQAENNIPVVGRDEVLRQREMHWMRIDRYYTGDERSRGGTAAVHQPMLCQHCDNAPCETVCPVLATVHSSEGLNQQVYNRCVGTRYCANNCPYKVRRFNWFDYPHEDRLQNMVLNPDVVVRSRGVMEKCSLCVQRIQEQKFEAKRAGRALEDGAIRTACEQSCPAGAIVFGDLNDPESRVSRLARDRRAYRVLEELNVEPSVGYLAEVRNRDDGSDREEDHRA